ncbi:MAG: hypothetical protein EBU59_05735 [Planctomycetia bacterium]|jgi:hypothetical protein|nr:hypothetical protein [Planctomycetia bacterium]
MRRQPTNPFYIVLGVVGFLFTITAASYCLSVLRGIRPETASAQRAHPLEELMDRHGTSLLVGQLVVLAIATVGAVAVDHVAGERLRRARQAEQPHSHLGDSSTGPETSPPTAPTPSESPRS